MIVGLIDRVLAVEAFHLRLTSLYRRQSQMMNRTIINQLKNLGLDRSDFPFYRAILNINTVLAKGDL
jgi:hypothetical protein